MTDHRCILCGYAAYHLDATGCCKWCRDQPPGHAVGPPRLDGGRPGLGVGRERRAHRIRTRL